MNRRNALVGAALLAVAPKVAAAQDDIAVRFLEAQISQDWDALESILHPAFTIEFPQGGPAASGRDAWIAQQREQPPSEFEFRANVVSSAEQGDYHHVYAIIDIDMGASGVLRAPYIAVSRVQDGLIINGAGGMLTKHLE